MRIKPVPVLQNKSRRYHAAAATQSLAYYSTPKPIIRRSRTSAGQRVGHGALSAVITRGSYGVPSVYASSMRGVWFGDGWAQAADRMAQLELTRRTVEGTLSGIFGPAELAQDEDVRTFFYTAAELQAQYDSMPAVTRGALSDFAAGINAYEGSAYACAASEQANVPYEFFALGRLMGLSGPYRPAPWSAVDTVAVGN